MKSKPKPKGRKVWFWTLTTKARREANQDRHDGILGNMEVLKGRRPHRKPITTNDRE